jgi:hypothetical protein
MKDDLAIFKGHEIRRSYGMKRRKRDGRGGLVFRRQVNGC